MLQALIRTQVLKELCLLFHALNVPSDLPAGPLPPPQPLPVFFKVKARIEAMPDCWIGDFHNYVCMCECSQWKIGTNQSKGQWKAFEQHLSMFQAAINKGGGRFLMGPEVSLVRCLSVCIHIPVCRFCSKILEPTCAENSQTLMCTICLNSVNAASVTLLKDC